MFCQGDHPAHYRSCPIYIYIAQELTQYPQTFTIFHKRFLKLRLTNPVNPRETRQNKNFNDLLAEDLINQNRHALDKNRSNSN